MTVLDGGRMARDDLEDDGERPLAFFDFETDPFRWNRFPEPFCVGFMDEGGEYDEYWNDESSEVIFWLLRKFSTLDPRTICFAHNGGKFDFIYLKDAFRGTPLIINGRVVKVECDGFGNTVELRDSYSMIPVPLSSYDKDEIDYRLLEREVRHQNKEKISRYLRKDCDSLRRLVLGFKQEFGLHVTMARAAMQELKKFHTYKRVMDDYTYNCFKTFYHGGRVQCFESGNLTPSASAPKGTFQIYDVNSMYPHVMASQRHPIGDKYDLDTDTFDLETIDFAIVHGRNDNALPMLVDGHLRFDVPRGKFHATGHELRTAVELGLFQIDKIERAYTCKEHGSFKEFVGHFYEARQRTKREGNKLLNIFYKLVLNSSYGKFAQDGTDFREWLISTGNECHEEPWVCEAEYDNGLRIHSRPTRAPARSFRHNVATAASITGAARAELLRGIAGAIRPLYCDTDCVICEGMDARAVHVDDTALGAWKTEASGDALSIAGKKLYALFSEGREVKSASKGVKLTGPQIAQVAAGATHTYNSDAPTLRLIGEPMFITRNVRNTAGGT